jgi:ABC-type antimicrobial peptide transport system permease subunit
MEQLLSGSLTQRRFTMEMLGVFGFLALLLAAIGIYGVMGYNVTQRTNEIGIRMALGAEPSQILRLFAGEGMWLATLGIGVGLGIAWVSTRFMRTLLFGVGADDPVTYAGVVVIVLGVALLASVLPARRAARVDPMEALRYE